MPHANYRSVDEYISLFPQNVRLILKDIRKTIHSAAPQATETIRYGIPTFKLNGKNLVHVAAFRNHIGFYPTPSGIESFRDSIGKYKYSKGSVQFPLSEQVPLGLIGEIVKFRVAEVTR